MDIFKLYETHQKNADFSLIDFLEKLRYANCSDWVQTDANGQNILHHVLQTQNISFKLVQTILKYAPELANIPDSQGLLPAQVIRPNFTTAYRSIKALLYEKTTSRDIQKNCQKKPIFILDAVKLI